MPEQKPKISIITAAYNNAVTLKDTLASVAAQDYDNIEHLIIDGLSNDNTAEVVNAFPHVAKFISEKDSGMYDAINKGIKLATGTYVGILNSDDVFSSPDILSQVAEAFSKNNVEAIYGDVKYVTPDLKSIYSNKLPYKYLDLCMVDMRVGGMSNKNLKNRYIVNKEMVRACRENGIDTNILHMTRKITRKLSEYLRK